MKNRQVHYLKTTTEIPNQPITNQIESKIKSRKKMLRSVSEDENANILKNTERKKVYKDKSFDRALPLPKNRQKQSKIIHSAPSFSKHEKMPPIVGAKSSSPRVNVRRNPEWIVNGISRVTVDQATFSHCFTLVTYIIQYRAGRSLFPVNTSTRKRQLTIQDLVTSMISYVENLEKEQWNVSEMFKEHMLEMAKILRGVEINMHPSRINTQRTQR